jgi:MFS family permease
MIFDGLGKEIATLRRNITREALFLSLASFLNDVSSEMIFPLLPLFMTNILGAPVAVVGLIEGLAEASVDILKMLSGWYSDKIGKRMPFVLGGYALSTVTKPLFAIATAWQQVLAIRVTDRVGKGIRGSARDAILADYTTKQNRGLVFGFRKMADSLGATVGPLIVFFLLPFLLSNGNSTESAYRTIFWLAFVPALLAVAILFFIREKEKTRPATQMNPITMLTSFDGNYRIFTIVSTLFALGNFSYAFLVLRSQDLGLALILIPIVYMFYNAIYAAAAIPVGEVSDRIGRKPVLLFGYLLFALVCIGFAFAPHPALVIFLFGMYGLFMAIMETMQRAYIVDVVPSEYRGTALGAFQGAIGVAALPASVIAGLLWAFPVFGAPATFMLSAGISVLSALLLALFLK